MASYTFFGIQIAIKNFFKDPLRHQLHKLIQANGESQTLAAKRVFWKKFTALVNEAMPVFERGHWDLIRGGGAQSEFETWSAEIEGAAATEAEEVGGAADEVHRSSAQQSYVLVTLMFLVEQDSNSDQTLGERCDIPESQYHTRQTFAHLVATVPLLNFAYVQADAVYLLPGSDEDGFSEDDLADEGYNYLKPLA